MPFKYLVISTSLALLIATAIHYPLATTFPIGGDAASFIRDAKQFPHQLSRYPASQATFAAFAALPLSWPDRYTWFAAFAFIAAGLSLGRLASRIGHWPAAAVAIVTWSTTLVSIQPHIEAGTLAQLTSLIPLFLFLERLFARAYKTATLFLLLTLLAHPLTGIISLLIAYSVMIANAFKHKSFTIHFALPVILLTLLAVGILMDQQTFFTNVAAEKSPVPTNDSLRSHFAPAWILAPIGFILLLKKFKDHPLAIHSLITFALLSILFFYNQHLGLGVLTSRFSTYFLSLLTLLFALALPVLVRSSLQPKALQTAVPVLLLTCMYIPSLDSARYVFNYYESPSRYARLHPEELAAIDWMKNNLPSSSFIVSSEINRHTEWIPILTSLRWHGLPDDLTLSKLDSQKYTHAIYLKKREPLPPEVRDRFSIIYDTKAAAILKLNP